MSFLYEFQLKHIQLMTGVSPWLYWFGHFVCDFAIMIFVTAFVGIIFCLDRHGTFGTISIRITKNFVYID